MDDNNEQQVAPIDPQGAFRSVIEVGQEIEHALETTRQKALFYLASAFGEHRFTLHERVGASGTLQSRQYDDVVRVQLDQLEQSGYSSETDSDTSPWANMCISAADAATLVGHARELGAGGYGAWLDAWSARMKDRLHELMQQRLIQLQKLAQEKPESVFRLICESVINKGGPLFASTAFRSFDGKERPSYFHDLAVVCLRTLDKEEPKTIDGKYIALSEYVLQEFSLHVYFHRDDLQSYDPDRIMHDAFDQPADSFSEALWRAAELVYHGVPLVRFTADGPQTVIEPDELYVFLSKKGELQDVSSSFTSLPEWTKGLAFELSHLEAHNLMFAAADQLTHVQVLARRSALRRMLALPVPAANGIDGLTLPTHSKLLLLMRQIVDRYYGPNFQIDEVDSWPRQKDVVDWLKAQGLSEREAMAIDIVSRPDRLRSR